MQARDNANKLRKTQTPEERLLWKRLKDRRLGIYKFRRQVPIDHVIVDFCCFKSRLIIELDGYSHKNTKIEDYSRDKYLKSQGFTIIRVWNSEIKRDIEKVIGKIIASLEPPSSGAVAPPSPVKGEGKSEKLSPCLLI